eukprot:6180683-Pleurochrysis_carterae.AAC.1
MKEAASAAYLEFGVDYRSIPISACGPRACAAFEESRVKEHVATTTGLACCADAHIMVARGALVSSFSAGGVMNLHHDRHKNDIRVATFMVYLSDVSGGGGETFFPVANTPADDALAATLRDEYARGQRLIARGSEAARECEVRLHQWRGRGDGDAGPGVGIRPAAGHAIVFDVAGDGGSDGSWHAPCLLREPGDEKWTLTFFQSPTQIWSSILTDG